MGTSGGMINLWTEGLRIDLAIAHTGKENNTLDAWLSLRNTSHDVVDAVWLNSRYEKLAILYERIRQKPAYNEGFLFCHTNSGGTGAQFLIS